MSYISDFKGAPISLYGVNGGVTSTDASLGTLCGSEWRDNAGRVWVLVQNGAVALVSGNLIQSPASIGANHTGLTLSTAAIGATAVTATLGGTAVTANQYAGGFLAISAGTGIGQTLQIASHPAQTSTSGTVVLTLADPLSVATLTSDSKGSLTLPQYGSQNGVAITTSGVVVAPTTLTGKVIGATAYPIPASSSTVPSYGFIVKRGPVAVINVSTTAAGLDLMPSTGTAGNVATYVVATNPRIGTSTVAGETAKAQLIEMQL